MNKRVVTVLVSDGFIELLGYDSREKTIYAMDNNMYEDTHPDNTHSPVSFTHLAKALTSDYLTLYYANIRTGRYVEYRGSDDFFASVRRSVRERVAPEDIEPLLSALTKENIMRSIEEMGFFVLFFRATVFGKMVPVNLKAVRIKHDRDHIILGLREKKELIESDLQTDALR